jgi:hypothetical protein
VKDDLNKPLEYEQRAATVSQRQYRRLMALTLLNTILLAGFIVAPTIGPMVKTQWNQFQQRREQRKAEALRDANIAAAKAYTAPAEQVLYEEDPDAAAKLLTQFPKQYQIIRSVKVEYFPPHPWQPPVVWVANPPPLSFPDAPTIFLHERTAPGGSPRLIRVRLQAAQKFDSVLFDANPQPTRRDFAITTERQLMAQAITNFGETRPGRLLILGNRLPNGRALWQRGKDDWEHGEVSFSAVGFYRFYPGQPDPADASHFTIRYDVDGVPNTIDGWLRDNDTVELIPRTGAAINRDPQGREVTWDPTIAPTTAPKN